MPADIADDEGDAASPPYSDIILETPNVFEQMAQENTSPLNNCEEVRKCETLDNNSSSEKTPQILTAQVQFLL